MIWVVFMLKGEDTEWVNVNFEYPEPTNDDWFGVFSPVKFNTSYCYYESGNWPEAPYICTTPIKYKFANHSTADYINTGKVMLSFQSIHQRADFAFALFTGGLEKPKLVAVSDPISFANPKAPLYPQLAHGKAWDEMTITWTSCYNIDDATPLVEWGWKNHDKKLSPAGTLTFKRDSMCGAPARNFGWRDPGFIHTSFLKDLWPNTI
ncbi:putative inactive purple acid phosphatase 24 [Bidens hawaiensis]|uniref:putative inactive purple acid phosphatase 24 n=1 Tax=Bidens hawaiensis TaxID=980011 RepID=UPI00404A8C9A